MYYNICIYNTHSWNYCQIFLKIGVSLDPTMWWICKKGRFQAGYYIYIYILIYVYYMDVQDEPSPKKWDTQWLDTYRMAHIQMIIGSDLGMWSFTHFGVKPCNPFCIVTQPSTLHVMNDANRRRPILLQGTTMHHLGHLPAENLTIWGWVKTLVPSEPQNSW